MAAAPLTLVKLARFAEGFTSGLRGVLVALAALATAAGAARAAGAVEDFFAAGLAALASGDLLAEVAELASVTFLAGSTEPTVPLPVAFFPPVVLAIANLAFA